MRVLIALVILAPLAGCGRSADEVAPKVTFEDTAGYQATKPPKKFLSGKLVVGEDQRPYCHNLGQVLSYLEDAGVTRRKWTPLGDTRWQLDGFNPSQTGWQHTIWVFEHLRTEGTPAEENERWVLQLVKYEDSKFKDRSPDDILKLYYPYLSQYAKGWGCTKDPYD